ncbi:MULTISPECIES: DAHL domain-containing protein [unclassified Neorhizobium]|uniref:DAHL domain-containing protein n=1 Tax=unclassified Neorhizobium TaxID=2629175 RepID=UPI001FF17DB4|nr:MULTISPECIES: DAHL domain-containing protein [unclassified Neorhizobium]MCJ9672009.1 ATP-binding protein [Neorhizobium sp. SHOUNA12B]MCJ9747949.1 ATP-binding protein [Neorhizobium sp. SHOUNA12A]
MRIAILLVAGLVSMILAMSRGPDGDGHEAILNAMRTINLSYAALQRDVLQARSGILKNYDFLGLAIDRMRAEVQTIDALTASLSFVDSTERDGWIKVMKNALDRNEVTIERFKSGNALIQNSLKIFIQTWREMQARPRGPNFVALMDVQQLGQQMWQFQNTPDPELAKEIRRGLMRLHDTPSPAIDDLKKPLLDHGYLILNTLPSVDEIVGGIQASDGIDGSLEFQRAYLQQFGQMSRQTSKARLILSGISLSLCAYATYLAFRLKFYADSLRWRLYVEQSVNDAITRLSLEPERFRIVMDGALKKMAEVFGFGTVSLITLNPDSWDVTGVFTPDGRPNAPEPLVQDFIADLREKPQPFSDPVLWRHRAPGSPLAAFCDLVCKRKPLALASAAKPHEGLVVMLVAECRLANWNMRTDSQILRMTTELLALAIEKHHRLTELDELDRRLEEAQRLEAVGTLAGGVAHEFNNILMAIMGYAEMAVAALTPGLPTRAHVEHILTAGHRAKLVVDQMLAFGRLRRNPALPFNVTAAVTEILSDIEICVTPSVRLHLDIPDTLLVILGHPIEIQQILVNLCKNAAEAIGGQGHVKLKVTTIDVTTERALSHGHLQTGHYVWISVTDTGPGIAPGHLQRIFEPFFTTRGDKGGTGLGLSVVHGTVKSLKGSMHVSSILGKGTRFDMFFPHLEANLAPQMIHRQLEDIPTGSGELVAIVDSDETSRHMWEERIAALGYEPAGFPSTGELSDWCSRGQTWPDAMVLVASDRNTNPGLPAVLSDLPRIVICRAIGATPPAGSRHVLREPVGARGLAVAMRAVLVPATEGKMAARR